MEKRIEGYTVLTKTLSGWELMWRVEGSEGREGETMPEVFTSERGAQLSIVDDLIDELNQFNEGDREWDEISWPGDEYMIVEIRIEATGQIWIKENGVNNIIMETNLTDWRKSL